VTFYVDGGTPLYGKLFFPRGFTTSRRYPAVVVGHGINALSIGIEKYAARFAERGLVALAIDYQSYGFSGSGSDDIRLLEPDTTTDDRPVTEKAARILYKRTNLNNVHEIADFRAAVSFLQGEPGIDPERIGIWGSSNGGNIVTAVAALDARVKAVVAQVITPRPAPRRAVGINDTNRNQATGMTPLEDAVKRVRTGQGGEVDGGFSFRSKVDQWSSTRNQDVQAGAWLDQIPKTTAVLFLPAEKDELTGGAQGAILAADFLKERGVTSQAIVLPGLMHFQAYSYAGFEVGSSLAADWFLKYLNEPAAPPAAAPSPRSNAPAAPATASRAAALPLPAGVTTRDVRFFSEAVECHGNLFLPSGFSAGSKAAAVVVAPGMGATASSVEPMAAALAGAGIVAMAIDYRGWGKSGAFIYIAEPVRWDDRLRFSQHTTTVRLRRKRLLPEAQVTDIRNAITFLQGEPGVDRTRIGMWGTDLSGGHAVAVAAMDARPKAVVAHSPFLAGHGTTPSAYRPTPAEQADMVKLARAGAPAVTAATAGTMQDLETRLAMAQFKPFLMAAAIPETTAVLFVVPGQADRQAADAAAKTVRGAREVLSVTGSADAAAQAAVSWFAKHL
jgi:dienelactone hydrolase